MPCRTNGDSGDRDGISNKNIIFWKQFKNVQKLSKLLLIRFLNRVSLS